MFPFPVPAANPIKTNHLTWRMPIFFMSCTNGGTNWTNPVRVNTDSATNDQWMPMLCVKPDGTQLFMAWYQLAASCRRTAKCGRKKARSHLIALPESS